MYPVNKNASLKAINMQVLLIRRFFSLPKTPSSLYVVLVAKRHSPDINTRYSTLVQQQYHIYDLHSLLAFFIAAIRPFLCSVGREKCDSFLQMLEFRQWLLMRIESRSNPSRRRSQDDHRGFLEAVARKSMCFYCYWRHTSHICTLSTIGECGAARRGKTFT